MLSAGAASTAVFAQNNFTFGLYPPAGMYTKNPLEAIGWAARGLDAAADPRCGGGLGCLSSLKVAFLQADTVFTRAQCEMAPAHAVATGMKLADPHMATVAREPDPDALDALLRAYQSAGVNVLVGCTYHSTATALVDALERLDWAPYAVVVSEAVGNSEYTKLIVGGWWQGEYIMGPTAWHKTLRQRGQFSGWTSQEFYRRYASAYDETEVSYHGAANFAAMCALAKVSGRRFRANPSRASFTHEHGLHGECMRAT
eukprot:7380713-Prymnesium_polylepis.1